MTLGTLFIIAAPSGAGKTTLVRALTQKFPTSAFLFRTRHAHNVRAKKMVLIITSLMRPSFRGWWIIRTFARTR